MKDDLNVANIKCYNTTFGLAYLKLYINQTALLRMDYNDNVNNYNVTMHAQLLIIPLLESS